MLASDLVTAGAQPVNASVGARLGQGELGSLGGKIWLGVVGLGIVGIDRP